MTTGYLRSGDGMNAKDVKDLTEKLYREGDVSFEEASAVAGLLKENEQELMLEWTSRDRKDAKALSLWFRAVESRLPKYGNYVHTVPLEIPYKELRGYEPFGSIFHCLKKLPFPLNVKYAEWTCFNASGCKTENASFEYVGEIMCIPKLREAIGSMKSVFYTLHGDKCASLYDSVELERSGEKHKKSVLYQASVVRTAVSLSLPVIYTSSRSEKRLLMRPSDIDKISFLLEYTPDNLVHWAYKEGFLNDREYRGLLEGEWIYIDRPDVVCDRFAEYCYECKVCNKRREAVEDDSWVDITR